MAGLWKSVIKALYYCICMLKMKLGLLQLLTRLQEWICDKVFPRPMAKRPKVKSCFKKFKFFLKKLFKILCIKNGVEGIEPTARRYQLRSRRGTKAYFKWNCPRSYIYLKWQLTFAPASEVAGGRTLPFLKGHGLPILKWYGMSSSDFWGRSKTSRRSAVTSNKCMIGGYFIWKRL
jgi:hypothetical protein